MSLCYYVRTFEPLPQTKRFFQCRCSMERFLKEVVLSSKLDFDDELTEQCFLVIRVDDEIFLNYRKGLQTTARYSQRQKSV